MICLVHLSFVAADNQYSTAQVSIGHVYTDLAMKQSHCVTLCYSIHGCVVVCKQSRVIPCYIALHIYT